MSAFSDIKQILTRGGIDAGESRELTLMLLEGLAGMSRVSALTDELPFDVATAVRSAANRVAEGEPVQYVLGAADFCGLRFRVDERVLIPRPETEELVAWVAEDNPKSVLDIGTGSGCIAISLAHLLPHSRITACDISAGALSLASSNAATLGTSVDFIRQDVLADDAALHLPSGLNCIVSNPPYICQSESLDMERNVLEHEPSLALFVPDDDPLLFYRAIAQHALHLLRPGGTLFFEINRRFGVETTEMLSSLGFTNIIVRNDQFDNPRMLRCNYEL